MDAIGRNALRRCIFVIDGVKSLRANATLSANVPCRAHVFGIGARRSHHALLSSSADSPTRPLVAEAVSVQFRLRVTPANSIFEARLKQHPPRPHPQRPLRFISRSFSSTAPTRCSSIIPSSIMADRDTLPANVKPSHYGLSISSLDFKNWSYQGKVT
jgi:hypothetical protein